METKETNKWLTAENLRAVLQVLVAVALAVIANLPPEVSGASAAAMAAVQRGKL